MNFNTIQGHDKTKRILKRAVKTGRLSHAYLFSGLEGIGKRLTAIALSKILLCPSHGLDPCGTCSACIQVEKGNHPDLMMISPTEKKTIPIESIRTLKQELSRKSFASGYKVCLIDDAETMTIAAENSLLKTLEEPPPDSIIILISAQPYRLLPTVLSRCQHIKFQPLPISTASALIRKKMNVDEETDSLLVSLTGGSPGKALQLNADYVKKLRDSWIKYSEASSHASGEDIFNLAEDFCRDKDTLDLRLNLLRLWYRDMILYKVYGSSEKLLNSDKTEEIVLQSASWSLKKLLNALFCIEDYSQTLDYNVNHQLAVEALLINLNSGDESFSHRSGRATAAGMY